MNQREFENFKRIQEKNGGEQAIQSLGVASFQIAYRADGTAVVFQVMIVA